MKMEELKRNWDKFEILLACYVYIIALLYECASMILLNRPGKDAELD